LMSVIGEKVIALVFRPDFQIEFWPWGFYSILTAFFNSYFKTCTNSLIYLKKPVLFLALNFLNVIVTLAVSIGGLFMFPETIVGPMYGRLLSGLVIFVAAHIVFAKFGVFKFEKEFLPEIKQFCIPFLFFGLSAWVLSQIDRYMLQSYITEQDLNTYDLVLKCFFGVEFIQNSLSAIIFPKVYEIWNKQDKLHTTKESNRYFNVFTAVNIIQLILFCIAVPLLYKLFITKKSFYEASSYIGLLAAGFGLRSIINFYISTIFFTRSTTKLLLIFGLTALFQIVLTYFASKQFGLLGVIYAGILTKIVQAALSAIFTRGIFHYEFNYFKIYVVPLLFLLVNMVQFYFYPAYDLKLYLLQLLVFAIVFFFLFRKEIKQVLIQFKVLSA
jgi:O-antigen/teichoic acid export membrane protein